MTDQRQSSALSLTLPSPAGTLTPAPLSRGREEIRADSPIDRLEGSIVTEMVVDHFRNTR